MKNLKKYLFLLLLFFNFLYSETLVIENSNNEIRNLDKYLTYNKNDFPIETIIHENFRKFNIHDNSNFKFSQNIYWLKLEINNKSSNPQLFRIDNFLIDELNLYFFKDSKLIKRYQNGIKYNYICEFSDYNKYAYEIPKGESTLYIKIDSSFSLLIPMHIVSKEEFYKQRDFENIFNSSFYAALFLMFFYNFFIFLVSKVKIYKYYLGYIIGVFGFLFFYDGYLTYLLFSSTPILNEFLSCVFFIITFISIAKFSSNLFQSRRNAFVLYRILMLTSICILPLVSIIGFFIALLDASFLYLIQKYLLLCTILITLLIISIAIRYLIITEEKISKIYAFIWTIFMVVTLTFIVNIVLGFIDTNLMTKILKVNILLEIVMMSLLIAYRLKLSNEKNLKLKIKNKEQELYILRQTRLASFGEVLNSIVHEWKQPLHRINMISLNLETTYNKKNLTKEYLSNQLNEIELQTKYMNDTVTQFLDYFSPQKNKEEFYLIDCAKKAIKLLDIKFNKNSVNHLINCKNTKIKTVGYKKEYIQVIIILLNNSMDAIIKEKIKNPTITLEIIEERHKAIFSVIDNAGGIKVKPIEKIFDANISTKDEKINSGIGLFIAKRIIEDNMNKKLICKNHGNGAKFSIIG
ncbi:sensor histidine kinase [Malaciobacter marinus]|uniref:sensor histidine kinase n=1 Tax=Malaciobacter marinus TaxID=505249 RepID=UPI003B00C9BA